MILNVECVFHPDIIISKSSRPLNESEPGYFADQGIHQISPEVQNTSHRGTSPHG